MKRIICFLISVLLVVTLSACGTENGQTDYTVLVNKENRIPDNWDAQLETVSYTNSLGDKLEIEKKTYDSFIKLKAALAEDNVIIDIGAARVTVAEQQKTFDETAEKKGEEYAKSSVTAPGYSEHHTGLALDLYLNINGKDIYEKGDLSSLSEVWEKVHAALAGYGFILRYPAGKQSVTGMEYEPWHIRYVGSADVAARIAEKGNTLEEYLNKPLKNGLTSSTFNSGDNSTVVLINISGNGQIAYAKEGGELKYGSNYVTKTARFILVDTNRYLIGAKPDAGSKFVKWTRNGEDFSTDEEVFVEIDGDTEFIAVFAEE